MHSLNFRISDFLTFSVCFSRRRNTLPTLKGISLSLLIRLASTRQPATGCALSFPFFFVCVSRVTESCKSSKSPVSEMRRLVERESRFAFRGELGSASSHWHRCEPRRPQPMFAIDKKKVEEKVEIETRITKTQRRRAWPGVANAKRKAVSRLQTRLANSWLPSAASQSSFEPGHITHKVPTRLRQSDADPCNLMLTGKRLLLRNAQREPGRFLLSCHCLARDLKGSSRKDWERASKVMRANARRPEESAFPQGLATLLRPRSQFANRKCTQRVGLASGLLAFCFWLWSKDPLPTRDRHS